MKRKAACNRCGWRTESPWRSGFSLVEMLVVIVIILILSGIVFRISGYATQRAGRSRTAYELELLHNILEEYYAVYGHYPPTSGNVFVDYQNQTGQNVYPPQWQNLVNDPLIGPNLPTNEAPAGLTFFIWSQYAQNVASPAEIAAYNSRWAHYFADLNNGSGLNGELFNTESVGAQGGDYAYSNFTARINDPYGRPYEYKGIAPDFQAYQLYSRGPDGAANTSDDIGRDRWTE